MNAAFDLISRLRQFDGRFNAREQRVASYVLKNLGTVAQVTITDLAKACEVSEPTVIRFCRTLGCEGYRDFKIRLAQNVAVSLQYLDTPGTPPATDAPALVDRVLSVLYTTANVMRGQLDGAVLERAADTLADARQVVFIGVGGGSTTVAFDGANRLFRLGVPAVAVSDGYLQRMRASTLGPGDVLFAVSSSGEAQEVVDSTAIAGGYGAATIALTRPGSRLAQAAGLSILIELPEDPDIFKPTASRLVHLAVIDALAMAVAQRRGDGARETLRRIRASLTQLHGRTGPQPIGD